MQVVKNHDWPFITAAFLLTVVTLGGLQLFLQQPMLLLERFLPGRGMVEVLLIGIYAAVITAKFLDPAVAKVMRPRLWLLFSAVFFAQLFLGLAGIEKMLMTGQLHLPLPALILAGPLYRGTGFFMLIMFVVTVILAGPAWCSHLCYFGVWDDFLSRRPGQIEDMPAWRSRARLAVFMAVVLAALLLRYLQASWVLAFSCALLFGMAGIMIMLVLSRRTGAMVHCVTWCPTGLLGNWLGRFSLFRMRIGENCSGCRQCSRVCRYDALRIEDIRQRRPGSSCTLCGDCVSSCHAAQINYRLLNFSPETARKVFVVLIISMHAIFLAVARI